MLLDVCGAHCCITAVSTGPATRGENTASLPLRLPCQPGENTDGRCAGRREAVLR